MPFYFRKECPLNSGYLTPWPQIPDGVEVNEWLHSLKRHERRALMRSLRDKQAKNNSDEMQNWTQSRKQPRPLPDNHE